MDYNFGSIDFAGHIHDFTSKFKYFTGIEDVQLIYLPRQGVERETKLQRLRTEVMSGAGPDIFIVNCGSADYALFPYPEKMMNSGFFLLLDDYIENHAQFTDWDKQEQVTEVIFTNELSKVLALMSTACWQASAAGAPYDDIIHETYELMQRKIRE